MNYRAVLIGSLQATGLYLAAFLIPVLGQIAALFAPLPLIMIYAGESRRDGISTIVFACLTAAAVIGWQMGILLFLTFGLMAIGTAEAMLQKKSPETASLSGGLLPVLVLGFSTALYFLNIQKNPIPAIEEYLRSSMIEAAALYTKMGLADMAAAVSNLPDSFIHYSVRLLPGIVIATSVAQAACCYGLSRSILTRRRGMDFSHPGLAAWHAPDVWIWGLIAALAFVILPSDPVKLAGWNALIVLGLLYTVQGVAIIEHYLRKAGITVLIRALLQGIILALPLIALVTSLGIIDIWADFRKVRPAAPSRNP